ncbi:hypothetical protein AB6A40_002427 [Gnathostoma spinigerum]|uniref:PID domain-containing protein n=1 Tax=Gnathostoma spinigerum TaxID=75299 RepID=A0ABD6EFM5_9BILA
MVGQQRMKEGPSETTADSGPLSNTAPGSPKTRLTMLKRSSTKTKAPSNNDPFRFQGDGVDFKAKLIGVRTVDEARGDGMCAEAMRLAKAAVKSAGQHKQRIILNISIDGIKIKDEKSQTVLHNFPVSRVSFIARDTTDARAFGFVYCSTDNQYKFYGIKTAQTADHAVLSIRDMFEIVFEMKKAHLAQVKQKQENDENKVWEAAELEEKRLKAAENGDVRIDNGVAVADLLDLESELHNIEQGVNQLQNMPAFVEDSWPHTEMTPLTQSAAFTAVASVPQPQPVFSISPPTSGPTNAFATSPTTFASVPSAADPFGDSFATRPAVPQIVTPNNGIQPTVTSLESSNPWCQMSGVHSAPNIHSVSFSETNPFASSVQPQSNPVIDPFDTKPALRLIESIAANQRSTSENSWPTKENNASFANFDNSRSQQPQWSEPRKVPSLEEAISKLVDMDALVSSTEIKKNPFEQLIHPPKIPISAMTGMARNPAMVPGRNPAPLVFPGAKNDPFNDDFFN